MDSSSVAHVPSGARISEALYWVHLDGAANVRDMGGYPVDDGKVVRIGQLFRGDSPHRLTPADLECLGRLGIRSRVDLRREDEVRHFGNGGIGQLVGVTLSAPLGSPLDLEAIGTDVLFDQYRRFALEHSFELATAIRFLADTNHRPALMHCYAGKDRTGVLAAILLGLLGVADDAIIADYAMTSLGSSKFFALAKRELYESLPKGTPLDEDSPALTSSPNTMGEFLHWMRSAFGSVVGFVMDAGVEQRVIDRLREDLLVEQAGPSREIHPSQLSEIIDLSRRNS